MVCRFRSTAAKCSHINVHISNVINNNKGVMCFAQNTPRKKTVHITMPGILTSSCAISAAR
jgi:hypothetical protein